MEIYLLRHGIAEDGKPGAPDSERALTGEGKKKLRVVLQVARRAEVKPDLILTSPYKRATETAKIAAEILGYQAGLVPSVELTPDAAPEHVWDVIRTHRDAQSILLASHEPLLGFLAAYLTGGPSSMFDMKKGALVRIDVEAFAPRPKGVLRWFLTPKLALGLSEP